MIALADCNNFFVSCERVFRPDLAGRAVVVLSNNDGCAVSRSNEAKALGIKMGQPLYQFAQLVDSGKVTVFSSNFILYGDMSRRVQTVLRRAAPQIEVYSIDESFLNLDAMDPATDFDSWAKQLSRSCRRNTGIPVSVGVAPTKTLAKIASKLCKQYPKLSGGCYMHTSDQIEKVLRSFPIDDVWGIGRRYSKRFKEYGIDSAWKFAQCSEAWVRREMGVSGLRTWRELRGEPCIDFEHNVVAKKQICVSRSFATELADFDELARNVSLFASMVCEKLRRQHSAAYMVTLFLFTNRHKQSQPQQYQFNSASFAIATDSTIEVCRVVSHLLKESVRSGYSYKKAGVIVSELVPKDEVQGGLFDSVDRSKHDRLMETVDRVNRQSGHLAVGVASQSTAGIKMNRCHLSPQYTTRLSDILVVKV